ncbi:hypothetical protein AB4874_19140, partial [Thioclava sp. 15-R06ZXC-3]
VCGTHQGQRSKPRKQAGHMTASDKCTNQIKNVLLCRSHPHMPFAAKQNSVGLGSLRTSDAPQRFMI